jgi:hypothetical protein
MSVSTPSLLPFSLRVFFLPPTVKYLGVTQIQGDQKMSVHVMITIQKVTSNVQSVPRQTPDLY